MLKNWKLLVGGLSVLALVGFLVFVRHQGYTAGVSDTIVEFKEAVERERVKAQDKADKAGEKLETKDAEAKVIYKTITVEVDKIVDRPVYLNKCFDVDGLHLANEALSGPTKATSDRSIELP